MCAVLFILNGGVAAWNLYLFAVGGHWWSLAAGVFSSLVALLMLALVVKE
jgi:hypothetical protein